MSESVLINQHVIQKQFNMEIIKVLFRSSQTEILPGTEVKPTYLCFFLLLQVRKFKYSIFIAAH